MLSCEVRALLTALRGRGSLWLAKPRQDIIITLNDGAERKGTSWETSPLDVAKEISKSLSERLVIAKVSNPSRDRGAHVLDPEHPHAGGW